MSSRSNDQTKTVRSNLFWFSFLALIEAVQCLIIVALIYSFIPFKPHPFATKLFALHQKGVQPEREMFFYRLCVMLSIIFYTGGIYLFRKSLEDRDLGKSIRSLVAVNALWIFLQLFAVFKIFVTGDPSWARYLLYAALAGGVVTRVFWPEIRVWFPRWYGQCLRSEVPRFYRWMGHALFCAFLVSVIYVPDLTKVLARMFVRDEFYHIDSFLMAPGWSYLNGLRLNLDVISQYSVVIPTVIGHLTKLLGGFNHMNVVMALMWCAIAYFILFYFFLRSWLQSAFIAGFGALLAVKLQMFHWGVAPLIWQFPSATVVRYLIDLPVLWLIGRHCHQPRMKDLWGAAVLCGVALAWMQDTGVYLLIAFYIYLAIDFLTSPPEAKSPGSLKSLISSSGLLAAPFAVGMLILLFLQGPSVLSHVFWQNSSEFAGLFLKGWGALPMYDGLKDRQFFAFVMGFVIPTVYTLTMIFVGALCFMKQVERKNLFAVVLCVYGLGLYHYFINRSAVSSYYVVSIPFVAIVCYWLRAAAAAFGRDFEHTAGLVAVFAMSGALLTSYWVTYYPNIYSLGGKEHWDKEVEFYTTQSDFGRDADLIGRLTGKDDRVALVSSFEVKILMDARRKPFFYYFPLVESRHMRLAAFRGTYLHTQERMKRTIEQLENGRPEYVFIEQKLFRRQIPPEYYQRYQTLELLINYLDEHYIPAEDGFFLMALKRKTPQGL